MSHSEGLRCPFHRSKISPHTTYTAHFEEPPQKTWWHKIWPAMKEIGAKISFSSFRNAWYIYSQKDINGLLVKICKPGELVSHMRTPTGTQYIVRDPTLLQLVLSQYRNEEQGLFHVPDNKKLFINKIVRDLYPEEMAQITDQEKEVISAVIFTAESAHISSLRARVMSFLKHKTVQNYKEQLDQIAGDILDQLSPSEKQACDPAQLVFEYAISVIGRLFTGYYTTRENYQKVVQALLTIGKVIGDGIVQRPPSEQEKHDYQVALQTMRELIEQNIALEPTPAFIAGLKENGFSAFAIKVYVFFLYLAGTETTAAVTHYLLLELGRDENRHYQNAIRQEAPDSSLLKKCTIEALRLNPPVYIMGRVLRKDVLLTLRDTQNALIWSKWIRKGSYLVNWVAGAGRNPALYPNPEVFNPLRFETIPTQFPWLPFTTGHHTCPGQFLAKAEMESLISEILKRFEIETPACKGPIETKGLFTLHADPQAKIKIKLHAIKEIAPD